MTMDLFKAILLGICAAVPVGPVLMLVFQKSVLHGHRTGWVTGLGGTVCDTAWAAVSLFAIALVQDYVQAHLAPFQILGGLLIAAVGVAMLLHSKAHGMEKVPSDVGGKAIEFLFQAMGCAFGNPAALAFMLVLVGVFGLSATTLSVPVWLVVSFVALGSAAYWGLASYLLARFGRQLSPRKQMWIARVSGAGVVVFGLVLIVRGIIML